MMRMTIDYEAQLADVSVLDGDNNLQEYPNRVASTLDLVSELTKAGNYIKREITIDTVMGLLKSFDWLPAAALPSSSIVSLKVPIILQTWNSRSWLLSMIDQFKMMN